MLVAGLLAVSLTALDDRAGRAPRRFREILGDIAHPGSATSAAGLNGLMHIDAHHDRADRRPGRRRVPGGRRCSRGVAQVGVRPTPQALKPDFRRINPVSGLKNLLGPNLIFEALKAIAKVAVVGAVAALAIAARADGPRLPTSASRRPRSAR